MSRIPGLLRDRRTVRLVRSEPVPPDLIDSLLEAACLAPSAHNRQPWRFVVVASEERRATLARAMAEDFRRDLVSDAVPDAVIEERVSHSMARLTAAPVLIIGCLAIDDLDTYRDAIRQGAEHALGVQSVAAAIENLLLAAANAGLGAAWMCAPMFCQDVVRRTLDLPLAWEPQALVTIGWPAESPTEPEREPFATRVVYR